MFQCVECMSLLDRADRFAIGPGATLGGLLPSHVPTPILADEPVSGARQLDGLEGLSAGVATPTPRAHAGAVTPRVLPVTSMAESQIEVCSEGGQATRGPSAARSRVDGSRLTHRVHRGELAVARRRPFKPLIAAATRRLAAAVAALAGSDRANRGESCSSAAGQPPAPDPRRLSGPSGGFRPAFWAIGPRWNTPRSPGTCCTGGSELSTVCG